MRDAFSLGPCCASHILMDPPPLNPDLPFDSDRADRNRVEGRFIGSGGVEGQQKILAALAKSEMQLQRAVTLPVRCVPSSS
jgi:hypothetical protein